MRNQAPIILILSIPLYIINFPSTPHSHLHLCPPHTTWALTFLVGPHSYMEAPFTQPGLWQPVPDHPKCGYLPHPMWRSCSHPHGSHSLFCMGSDIRLTLYKDPSSPHLGFTPCARPSNSTGAILTQPRPAHTHLMVSPRAHTRPVLYVRPNLLCPTKLPAASIVREERRQ